jgi:hypothetical protein
MSRRKERHTLTAGCPPGEDRCGSGASEHHAELGRSLDIADLDCCVQGEVGRVAMAAAEYAETLQSIGGRAFETAGVLHEHCPARELLRTAHEVQGLVAHGLAVLAGLQLCAGRMQALSAVRQAREEALGGSPESE